MFAYNNLKTVFIGKFATAIGVSTGISILVSMIKGTQFVINIPWDYSVPMVSFLFMGAVLETLLINVSSKYGFKSN